MDADRMWRLNQLSNEVRTYIAHYRRLATQLAGGRIGWEWWKTGVSAEVAARWANEGYLPGEAMAEMRR